MQQSSDPHPETHTSSLSLEVGFYLNPLTLHDQMSYHKSNFQSTDPALKLLPPVNLARAMENLAKVTTGITIKCGWLKKTKGLTELYFKP